MKLGQTNPAVYLWLNLSYAEEEMSRINQGIADILERVEKLSWPIFMPQGNR